ncbi:MAG: hypothetical protein RR831_02815 [Stenotrophomonas sp.]
MENLWPDSFEESEEISPKRFFDNQAKNLAKITNNLVFAEIEVLDEIDVEQKMRNPFIYSFSIHGRHLRNYKFKVMTFSHDINIFPIKFRIDQELSEELEIPCTPFTPPHFVQDAENLEVLARKIFQSRRVRTVVSSIMRLSK